ncbi:kelch-like protein 24a isoform X2 [Branchiostoma lanceolatum]
MDNSGSVDESHAAEVSKAVDSKTENDSLDCDASDCYPAFFLQQLQKFRSEGHLVDVTLCAEGQEIPCHRLVLSACSDYFHAMFSGAHSESKKDRIEIGGVSAEALQLLVDFTYTSKVAVTTDNVHPLYEAANMLQVKAVENGCEKFLTDNLSPETYLGTWALADKVSCKRLSEKAKLYALKHFEEVCTTEEFLELPVDFLKTYISDDGLHTKKEERVLEVIVLWARHDLKERRRHIKTLLECVCFSHVDPDYLKNILKKDKLLSSVPGVSELIQDQSRHARPRHIHQEEILLLSGITQTVDDEHKNDNIYRLGLNCDCIEITPLPEYLVNLVAHAACVVDNDVIVTGRVGSFSECKAWRYKPSLNSWSQLGPLVQEERRMYGMAVSQGQVYVVGGLIVGGWITLPDVEVYSEMTDSWKLVAPLQEGVRSFGITTCCEKIFIFGGKTGKCTLWDDSHNTGAVQCYDPTQNVCTFAAPLPNPMDSITACTVNSKIYLVGGQLAHVLCYDPQNEHYEKMAAPLAPWCDSGVTVCGSEIYITGGCERKTRFIGGLEAVFKENVPHATVQCYNVASDTMIMLKALPLPIWEHMSVTIPKL